MGQSEKMTFAGRLIPPRPLRIVHVVASIAEEASGPSQSVPALADAQARQGHNVMIFSVGREAAIHRGMRISGVHDVRFPPGGHIVFPSRLSASPSLARALENCAADVIHNHGLWLLPNIYAAVAARRIGALFALSPRGMLSPAALSFSRRKKRAFGLILQDRKIRRANLIHATSDEEANDARSYGIHSPSIVVPNGVDLPLKTARETDLPFILSLGRVHPKKGLKRLIGAFAKLSDDLPNWRLVIAGPDEGGHTAELKRHAASLGVDRIEFRGPVYGDEKWQLYGQAAIFALPTLSENFAMSVAEALASGTPVISSRGAPWSGLETEGAGLWVDHGVEPFAEALAQLMAITPADRATLGQRGREWMRRDFSWDTLARRLTDGYYRAMETAAKSRK